MFLAFSHFVASQVVNADGLIDDTETAWMSRRFPQADLRRAGFLDGYGRLNEAYTAAAQDGTKYAMLTFSEGRRMSLLREFVELAAQDGEVHDLELMVLRRASSLLGLRSDMANRLLASCTLVPA